MPKSPLAKATLKSNPLFPKTEEIIDATLKKKERILVLGLMTHFLSVKALTRDAMALGVSANTLASVPVVLKRMSSTNSLAVVLGHLILNCFRGFHK